MATVQNRAGSEVRQAAANPALELLERLGYVVRGTLYAVMGFLALKIALSSPGGKATDLSGSLVWLIGNPLGNFVLVVTIIGLVAYALWGFVRAIYDPLLNMWTNVPPPSSTVRGRVASDVGSAGTRPWRPPPTSA